VLVCDALVPPGSRTAAIGDIALPLPQGDPQRIIAFGDSGCRMEKTATTEEFQSCNDPGSWPFAETSASAAALAPDLVLHVGDYLYRESACPAGRPGCTGSPIGDDWAAWQADFFTPAAALLKVAPWVMVRGNHENCDRAWQGFFRLLDPRPLPQACPYVSPVYDVADGKLSLVVLDSGEADDEHPSQVNIAYYRAQFAAMKAPPGSWLVTHRPVWAVDRRIDRAGKSYLADINVALQDGAGNALPAGISFVLSGHIHIFEALGFADRRPPQLVVGTAGSSLANDPEAALTGDAIAGTTIAYARTVHGFGITVIKPATGGLSANFRAPDGASLFTCDFVGPQASCSP
jgi:Calcineurin-like phosphoesterase